MIAAIDVAYRANWGAAACILFNQWSDSTPARETTCKITNVAPYESGKFFRRELPCILAALNTLEQLPDVIVIDGFV